MRQWMIVLLTGVILADLAPMPGAAEEPQPQENAAPALRFNNEAARQILVQMQISDEQDGKREILSRPQIRSLSGQPANVQIGRADGRDISINLVAVSEPKAFASPSAARARADRKNTEGDAPVGTPILITLSVNEKRDGETKNCCQAQLTTCSGEPTSLRFGGLEVQFTAMLAAAETEKNEESAISREELRLLNSLQKRISVEFSETPLKDVIKEIAKRAEVNVFVDARALEDEGVTTQSKITASARAVRLSTLLDLVLGSLQLDYVVADEVIKITSRTRARGEPVTVTYAVADLIVRFENGQAVPNPEAEHDLIDQIAETISPETWDRKGGKGGIRIFQPTGSLVIRQVTDVHDEIAEFLSQLRRAHKPSVIPAAAEDKPTLRVQPQVSPNPPS
jgi:hypothetical protein